MSGVLARILAQKAAEVAALKLVPAAEPFRPRGASVIERLRRADGEALRLITEIKRKSPSAGVLSTALSVGERARVYAQNGATMISVLADAHFFDGSWANVAEARRTIDGLAENEGGATLVLAKEFVIDERQIDEAAAVGADAVLLIVRCLAAARVEPLVDYARARGLEPLVEIVDEPELETALAAEATVIGVNARDLDELVMDTERATRVLARIPDECLRLRLSGVKSADDVRALAGAEIDAALIGESLMRLDDPAPLLRAMRDAAIG